MANITKDENVQTGITLNKKTILVICILLAAIKAFAGVLTQVMPRGVFELDAEVSQKLGFSSITHYQYCHICDINRPYNEIMVDVKKEWEVASSFGDLKYFPHVSIGWDNNPRFTKFKDNVSVNNTPQNFEKSLRYAKEYCDKKGVRLVTVNSWNEWTETSYLQPDDLYGYGYLEKIKEIFKK